MKIPHKLGCLKAWLLAGGTVWGVCGTLRIWGSAAGSHKDYGWIVLWSLASGSVTILKALAYTLVTVNSVIPSPHDRLKLLKLWGYINLPPSSRFYQMRGDYSKSRKKWHTPLWNTILWHLLVIEETMEQSHIYHFYWHMLIIQHNGFQLHMVVHIFNPKIREAETIIPSVDSRPAWTT